MTQHTSVDACVDALHGGGDAAEAIGARLVSWCSSGPPLHELTPVFECGSFTTKDLLLNPKLDAEMLCAQLVTRLEING